MFSFKYLFLRFKCSAPLALCYNHLPRVNKGYLFIYLFIFIWVVHVISMEFLRSLLRRRFARAQVATSRNVGCFLRLILGLKGLTFSICKTASHLAFKSKHVHATQESTHLYPFSCAYAYFDVKND